MRRSRREVLRDAALTAAGLYLAPSSVWAAAPREAALPVTPMVNMPLYKMKPEAFARRPLGKARVFAIGVLYPGYQLDGKEATAIRKWLDEFRFWQTKLGSPYVPYLGYRFDLATYADEPNLGWQSLEDAYVRVPAVDLEAKKERFRAAGWEVSTDPRFARWEDRLRQIANDVELAVLPFCKGETKPAKKGSGTQKRCVSQSAVIDPAKVVSLAIAQCLAAVRSFGVAGVLLGCKRAWYSPDAAGRFKAVFGPDAGENHMAGPLIAPPFAPGHWDAAWIEVAEALREEGVAIVKPERPRGFPDRSGASWLPADLRSYVTEMGGPEQL